MEEEEIPKIPKEFKKKKLYTWGVKHGGFECFLCLVDGPPYTVIDNGIAEFTKHLITY